MSSWLKEKLLDKGAEHDRYMQKLKEENNQAKLRIEKDMGYIKKLFEESGSLIDFQDSFVTQIDQTLAKAEDNSALLLAALKKRSDSIGCQQKILNSIIISLFFIILLLVGIVIIKSL